MNSNIKDLESYILNTLTPGNELLAEIFRSSRVRMNRPRMVSDPVKGRLLAMISKMIAPGLIVEIGTFTGYSALCLAEGLTDNGKIITIERNDELEEITLNYFKRSPLFAKIDFRIGDALSEIPNIQEEIDLAYIDGEKSEYSQYFTTLIPKIRKGGFILADNILWDGKVLEPIKRGDIFTKGIIEFNSLISNYPGIENSIIPYDDGLMIIRKIE
jgi:caffeoyl-CoA O-methyltransferase